jgi:hypothetical protein
MTTDTSNEEHGLRLPARDDDAKPDIDLTTKKPLRLGVADGDTVWLSDAPGDVIRVRAEDLRGLADQVGAVRRKHPGFDVLVDIDVVIADEARAARAAVATAGELPDRGTLRYVGTAAGLAGLVADVYALGLSDGAMLIPLPGEGGEETSALIRGVVIPELATLVPDDPVERQRSRPR